MSAGDFVDFKTIIAFAVEREEEAARGYGEMMVRAKHESLKRLLADLKAEEEHHKKLLTGLSSADLSSLRAERIPDLKITDDLLEAPLDEESNFQDLLIFAAKKEQKAVELYSRLLEAAATEDLKKLFAFLVSQEKQHKLKLETEYENRVLWEN